MANRDNFKDQQSTPGQNNKMVVKDNRTVLITNYVVLKINGLLQNDLLIPPRIYSPITHMDNLIDMLFLVD